MLLTNDKVCYREIACHFKLRFFEDAASPVYDASTGDAVQGNFRNRWLAFFGLKASNMKNVEKYFIFD